MSRLEEITSVINLINEQKEELGTEISGAVIATMLSDIAVSLAMIADKLCLGEMECEE